MHKSHAKGRLCFRCLCIFVQILCACSSNLFANDDAVSHEVAPRPSRRLGWVVSISPDSINRYSSALSSFNCYALLHQDVTFFVETEVLVKGRHFFHSRLRNIAKYLQHFAWILHSDADIIVPDHSRSFHKYLDDRVDVILQRREGRSELHAGMYLIRNFAHQWAEYVVEHGEHLNYDNGDLHEVVLDVLGIEHNCSRYGMTSWDDYAQIFLPCFWTNFDPAITKRTVELVEVARPSLHVQVYREAYGFLGECHMNPNYAVCTLDKFATHGKDLRQYLRTEDFECQNITA